jgi:hypothetical protein
MGRHVQTDTYSKVSLNGLIGSVLTKWP